jgi:hypothetical protein
MGKSPVPFVFCCKQGKSEQQTKRMEYPLKKAGAADISRMWMSAFLLANLRTQGVQAVGR